MAFADTFQLANGWIWGTSVFSAAQTATVLVVAPAAGSAIEIAGWILESDATANAMTLHDEDDNNVVRSYLSVDGGRRFILPVDLLEAVGGIKLVDAKALEITTVGGTASFIAVLYRIATR